MPRPKRARKIFSLPLIKGFKPFGNQGKQTETLSMLLEEYEAIKLADYNHFTQEHAAEKMNVSRPTFTRIYDSARKVIAQAFVEGKAIVIEGGNFSLNQNLSDNSNKKQPLIEFGKGGFCICLKCDIRVKHENGVPCKTVACPGCGKQMMRENSFDHFNLKNDNGDL